MPNRLVRNSATVKALVLRHFGAIKYPMRKPLIHMVICMVIATIPYVYAIEPQTTKVPAEKKLIKRESPLMGQGTAPPAAKKDFISAPCFPKDRPATMIIKLNTIMVRKSKYCMDSWLTIIGYKNKGFC